MFAKAAAVLEQKAVGGIGIGHLRRLQGVGKTLAMEIFEHALGVTLDAAVAGGSQLAGKGDGARIAGGRRQAAVEIGFAAGQPLVEQAVGQCFKAHAAHAAVFRHAQHIAQFAVETALFKGRRIVEGGQHAALVGNNHLIADAFAFLRHGVIRHVPHRLPGAVFIGGQGQHAPIELLALRHIALIESGGERRFVALHQIADAAGLHAVGKAGNRLVLRVGHLPQRRFAPRHGNKQQQHQRQGQQKAGQALAQSRPPRHFVQQRQHQRHHHQTQQHPQTGRRPLVEQHRTGGEKQHRQHQHLPVAPAFAFVRLQQRHQQQKSDAALQADNAAQQLPHCGDDGAQQRQQQAVVHREHAGQQQRHPHRQQQAEQHAHA